MEPLLSNPGNLRDVPLVVAQDLKRHVHDFKNEVFVMAAKVKGTTYLPLPQGLEQLEPVDKRWLLKMVDFNKHAFFFCLKYFICIFVGMIFAVFLAWIEALFILWRRLSLTGLIRSIRS